jgi:phosphoribosylformylglycinamidine synthase
MPAIKKFAAGGGAILGICNGFQVLTESHLLPGILLRNAQQTFICKNVELSLGTGKSLYHSILAGRQYSVPIAHGEGRYFVSTEELVRMQDRGQILFQYCDSKGLVSDASNPNGAVSGIAGVLSENGRILGMMPHPERASDQLLGSNDGKYILSAFLATIS